MTNIERKNPSTDKAHRRRGAAFDTFAHVFRDVREMYFQNGLTIKNRPGTTLTTENDPAQTGFIKVFSLFEIFFEKAPSLINGINAIIFGRGGKGERRNTSLIEFSARHVSEISNDLGQNNGSIKLRVTRDDEDPPVDNSGVTVADAGTLGKGLFGLVVRIAGDGESGGVTIAHISSKDQNPSQADRRMQFLNDGIYFFGLPTSSSGLSSGALWNDGGTLKIVP